MGKGGWVDSPAALDIFGVAVTIRIGCRYYKASKILAVLCTEKVIKKIIFVADLVQHTSWYNSLTDNWEPLLSVQFKLPKGTEQIKETSHKIQEFYFGDKAVSEETWPHLVDVCRKMHQLSVFMSSYYRSEHDLNLRCDITVVF
jgi:hypothetical protein